MRIEDLDISKLSEEEFNKKIGNALADIHRLVERGIEERNFAMNLFAITSILVEDEETIYNIDNSIVNEGMAEHIALTSESIGEIIETFSIRKLFTEFGVDEDE